MDQDEPGSVSFNCEDGVVRATVDFGGILITVVDEEENIGQATLSGTQARMLASALRILANDYEKEQAS